MQANLQLQDRKEPVKNSRCQELQATMEYLKCDYNLVKKAL